MSSKRGIGAEALLAALVANAYTVSDAHAWIRALAEGVERERFGAAAGAGAPEGWDAAAAEDLAAADDPHGVLAELARMVGALPVLVLYTPARLSPEGIERLGRWCRANVDARVLLNLHADPAAAGGCILAWQDHLHDFSLGYFLAKERPAFARALAARIPLAV